jgi:hypothetical protein
MPTIISKSKNPEIYGQLWRRGLFSHPATNNFESMYVTENGLTINDLMNKVEKMERIISALDKKMCLMQRGCNDISSVISNTDYWLRKLGA